MHGQHYELKRTNLPGNTRNNGYFNHAYRQVQNKSIISYPKELTFSLKSTSENDHLGSRKKIVLSYLAGRASDKSYGLHRVLVLDVTGEQSKNKYNKLVLNWL